VRRSCDGRAAGRAARLESLNGEIQRHHLQVRVAPQPGHRLKLAAKPRIILVRSNRRQNWTQSTLQRNLTADASLFLLHTTL